MIDAAAEALLQELVRRLSRSLLQYVSESFPFTTGKDQGAAAVLARLVREEQEVAARVGRFLLAHRHRLPYLGAYPMSFTTINYVTLRHLIPYLINEDQRLLDELASKTATNTEVRILVREVHDLKQRHLDELRKLI